MKTQNSYNINQNTYNEDILFNNFSSNSIIFHRLKSKTNDFCLRKNRIMGQEIASLQKIRQNFCPGFKSYIKFHISSVTLCDLSFFNPLVPTYWHQEEPLRSVNLDSPIMYSKDTFTLLLTLELCYKPLGIFQRVIKNYFQLFSEDWKLESSFSNSETSRKNNTPIMSTETLRMVIYLWKSFL